MEYRTPGRVFRVRFLPPPQLDLFASPEQQLLETLRPGNRTSRYRRTWILGQTEVKQGVLFGRIGYQSDGSTEIYDDDRKDFIDVTFPSGATASFAIRLDTLEAAIQANTGLLKISGIIGAFREMLANAGFKWRIVGLHTEMSLSEWKASVSRVVSVRFTIRKPNPHYSGRDDLKALMEDLESEVIRLEAANDDGINLNSSFVRQTEEHIESGYGDAEYRGVRVQRSDVHESLYSTSVGLEETFDEAPVDPISGEVSQVHLRAILQNQEGREGVDAQSSQADDE